MFDSRPEHQVSIWTAWQITTIEQRGPLVRQPNTEKLARNRQEHEYGCCLSYTSQDAWRIIKWIFLNAWSTIYLSLWTHYNTVFFFLGQFYILYFKYRNDHIMKHFVCCSVQYFVSRLGWIHSYIQITLFIYIGHLSIISHIFYKFLYDKVPITGGIISLNRILHQRHQEYRRFLVMQNLLRNIQLTCVS